MGSATPTIMDSVLDTVIVGYDGSASGRDALALGEVLTERLRADLVAARVYPWDPSATIDSLDLAELERAAGAVGGRVEVVASEAPAHGLQDLAVELGADLLVVGSDGHDRSHRTAAGPVALQLLHGTPCQLAVATRGFARRYAPDIRTIVAGYDGSDGAAAVLGEVAELARALGARVRVIAACPEENGARLALADRLEAAVVSLPREIECEAVLRSGDPARVLLEQASLDTDLLAVASRRDGPTRRALLGSVSAELVRRSPCPVLVIPREPVVQAPSARLRTAADA